MAIFKKTTQVVKPVVKGSVKPVAKVADGFQVVSVDSIDFLETTRGGGGKPMEPATAKFIEKALTLQIGQGIKVPTALRVDRPIKNSTTGAESILYTYKGAVSLSKRVNPDEIRFRTRRDKAQNLWLFAVEPFTEEERQAQAERKAARQAAKE